MGHIRRQEGIALLIALLLVGVLFGISTSLLNVTLKQYQLSGIAFASETAFQAANAGIECALYHDFPTTGVSPFDVPGDGSEQLAQPSISCMGSTISAVNVNNGTYTGDGDGRAVNGEEQQFTFNWPSGTYPASCVEVSVYKFYSTTGNVLVTVRGVPMMTAPSLCQQNSVCTVIQSRGYNVACSERNTSGRVVEREFTQVY